MQLLLKYLWEKTSFKEHNSHKPLEINTVTHRPKFEKRSTLITFKTIC